MSNWLEDDERRYAQQQSDETAGRQAQTRCEEDTIERLSPFFDICKRVATVRAGSLRVDRLVVEGLAIWRGSAMHRVYGTRRKIQFRCNTAGLVFIEAVAIEVYEHKSLPSEHGIVVSRRMCSPQQFSEWQEEGMLRAMQWLLNQTSAADDSLPGEEILNAEGKLVVRYSCRAYKDPDDVQVFVDGKPVGFASRYDHILERWGGAAFDIALGTHQLTVNAGTASRSIQVHMTPDCATSCDVAFSWLGLKLTLA